MSNNPTVVVIPEFVPTYQVTDAAPPTPAPAAVAFPSLWTRSPTIVDASFKFTLLSIKSAKSCCDGVSPVSKKAFNYDLVLLFAILLFNFYYTY